jgi:adenine-specific DNA-methyltransferase
MTAANAVANTAGTYGCFLRKTTQGALAEIYLTPRKLLTSKGDHVVSNTDVFDVSTQTNSLTYLDPPYTKRQYAAYYHILETIAHEDYPTVSGITGLRPWKEKSSLFCHKAHALVTLEKLVRGIKSKRILLSYSSDGHISMEEMRSFLKAEGELKVHESSGFKRYTPNEKARISSANKTLTEFIFELSRR